MSGTNRTKGSNSHTSREAESSHKATPQQKSSSTESREVAAAKKSFSVAKAPVTSAAAVKSTKATVGKRPKPPANLSGLELGSVHAKLAKIRQVQAAFDAKAAQDAAEKKAKADAEKLEAAQKRQERIAFLRGRGKNTSFDTTWVIKPQRNSAPKKGITEEQQSKKTELNNRAKKRKDSSTSTSSKKVDTTTTKQPELPKAESESASTEIASTSHDAPSSPVPASAPGNATARSALYEEISDGHSQLTESQMEKFRKFLNKICKRNFDQGDDAEFDDIPFEALQKLATWIKHHLAKNEAAANAGGLENTQDGQSEQSEFQPEQLQPSPLAGGVKKHRKRPFDDDNDDAQATSEGSGAYKLQKTHSSEFHSSPREESASVMPSSIQNSVTVYSATVNAVPAVTGGMIPFGADGNAAQKYHNLQEQRFNVLMANLTERGSVQQVQKRTSSEAQLPELAAKKLKQSDEEKALLDEAQQATEEPMAEAKAFKQEDVMEKREVASSAGDESHQVIDHAPPVFDTHGTATGEDTTATETEHATKEEAHSNNDEENRSPNNSTNGSSNDEEKVPENTNETDSVSTNTASKANEHQDATQGDNKASQTSNEKSAESSNNQTTITTTEQQGASHSGKAQSTSKTQSGQKSVNSNASTTTSGSATQTTTQQKTAQKSKKNTAQGKVAKASKNSAKKSDNAKNHDETDSASEEPVKTKRATKTKPEPKPQSKSKASAARQPSAATQQPPQPRITGAARFIPTSTPYSERQNNSSQASTKGQQALVKKPLADKSNTHRQPTKPAPKSTPAPSINRQPAAAKPVASKKTKQDEDAAAEKTTKSEKKPVEQSKKRSRKDDQDGDDDAGTSKKATKKQRLNPSSMSTPAQPDPHASEAPRPPRASRRQAARDRADAEAAAAAAALRRQATQPPGYNFDLPTDGYDTDDETTHTQPQSQAQSQAPGSVNEGEKMEEDEQKNEETNGDDAEDGVKEGGSSGDAGNAEDAPTSNGDKPQAQKKKDFIAHAPGQEPKRTKKAAPRQQTPAAARKRVGRSLTMDK